MNSIVNIPTKISDIEPNIGLTVFMKSTQGNGGRYLPVLLPHLNQQQIDKINLSRNMNPRKFFRRATLSSINSTTSFCAGVSAYDSDGVVDTRMFPVWMHKKMHEMDIQQIKSGDYTKIYLSLCIIMKHILETDGYESKEQIADMEFRTLYFYDKKLSIKTAMEVEPLSCKDLENISNPYEIKRMNIIDMT